MSSYEQCEEQQQQHTFAIVPTRVINERTYVCDLLEPHELPTNDTNLQQTCVSYVCNTNNDTNTNNNIGINNNNACVYTSYDNTNVYNNNHEKGNNYTSVSSYASNGSINQNEKTLFSIEPHLLLFPPPHHGRCIQNVLMLHNSSAKEMCVYKLKCEKPHAFVAKHNVGLMYANSSLELRVTLRAVDKESEFNDRKEKGAEERNNNNNDDDVNENNISYKEINENSVVHFRLEIKFFKKLPERYAKHLHFKKEHSDKDDSRNSDDNDGREEEDDEDEENDIENNKILNECVNAREVWNFFASFDEHSSGNNHQEHHHHHFNEHYHEDEQEQQNEEKEGQQRHRSSGITQCEVIDLKAFFDGFTKRPETSTIIELPADYPNGLHSYERSHHGHSTKEEHDKETDHKTSNASEDANKNKKESTEQPPMPSEQNKNNNTNNENVNILDNKVNDINNNNTITNNDDNKSIKTKDNNNNNNNNTIIDNKDADAPPSMLSASPTKRTKLEEDNKNEQQQQQEKKTVPNASTAPSSLTNNPANNNINTNKIEKDNTNVNKDDNISFDSKALPRSFEENKDKATSTATTNIKSEAAASAPAPPTSAPANNTDNVEGATESLFELYPNDDKPTNRAEPTDAFNDTTDALTSDKKASERAQDQLNDQQKHISFANYSNTLLQAPLSIDNLAASIRASTIYNKSVVLTNKMRPYANMLLICIGFICVLALLLPPPQEKQQQAK